MALLIPLSFLVAKSSAQCFSTVWSEDFETAGNPDRYMTSEPEAVDHLGRTDGTGWSSTPNGPAPGGDRWWFATRDLDQDGTSLPVSLSFPTIDVSQFIGLSFNFFIQPDQASGDFDLTDFVIVNATYTFPDQTTSTETLVTYYGVDGGNGGGLAEDTNGDGLGNLDAILPDGAWTAISRSLQDASTVTITIFISTTSTSENIFFDAFRIAGCSACSAAVFDESFATEGIDTRYFTTQAEFSNGVQVFGRSDGSDLADDVQEESPGTDTYFWATRDVGGVAGGIDPFPITLTFAPQDIFGRNNLVFSVAVYHELASGQSNWETEDFAVFQYSIDGSPFQTLLAFRGTGTGPLRWDQNLDGTAETEIEESVWRTFGAEIAETGSSITFRVQVSSSDGESFHFDEINVDGCFAPVLTCPLDRIVECDGSFNSAEFETWLAERTCEFDDTEAGLGVYEITETLLEQTTDCGATGSRIYEFTCTTDFDGPELFGLRQSDCCSTEFRIQDTTGPNLSVMDLTVDYTDIANPPTVVCGRGTTCGDTCSGSDVTTSCTDGAAIPGCTNHQFSLTRSVECTDDCGIMTTMNQMINVQDTTPPVLTSVPAPASYNPDETVPSIPTVAPTVVCTDSSGTATSAVTGMDVSDGMICPETVTRTFSCDDGCNNTGTATQTITLLCFPDITIPVEVDVMVEGSVIANFDFGVRRRMQDLPDVVITIDQEDGLQPGFMIISVDESMLNFGSVTAQTATSVTYTPGAAATTACQELFRTTSASLDSDDSLALSPVETLPVVTSDSPTPSPTTQTVTLEITVNCPASVFGSISESDEVSGGGSGSSDGEADAKWAVEKADQLAFPKIESLNEHTHEEPIEEGTGTKTEVIEIAIGSSTLAAMWIVLFLCMGSVVFCVYMRRSKGKAHLGTVSDAEAQI